MDLSGESKGNESFARTSSLGSSMRRRSMSLSSVHYIQMDNDIDSRAASEAGDIGDRALPSKRYSESGSLRLPCDHSIDNGVVSPIPKGSQLNPISLVSRDLSTMESMSRLAPLPMEIVTSSSTDGKRGPEDDKQDEDEMLPLVVEYMSCLAHLGVFGILGLFGPAGAAVTRDGSILYLDLPSNMVGSFLMGWFGVVFKGEISKFSDFLAIGLTTGYLGSLTTFSGWNQKMLDLIIDGKWLLSILGFLVGLLLAAESILTGVETAKSFGLLVKKRPATPSHLRAVPRTRRKCHFTMMVIMIAALGSLWAASGILLKHELNNGGNNAHLWLACIAGPPGVWLRWFLARLNGRGLGKSRLLEWVPFGTLIANVSAACLMAALSTMKKAVNTKTPNIVVTGVQFGFLGSLSTVSTLMAEYNAMRQSKHLWRAHAYTIATIAISFGLGVLICNLPVWIKGYE